MVNFAEFKKFFLFGLIGSLIIAALVAVVTVLIGDFKEVTGKVLFTLLMVVLHSLISLIFIWDDKKQNTFERLTFFINVLFIFIVISFVTSIFGVWEIIPGKTVLRLYASYLIIILASLHGNALSKATKREKYMDLIIYANYFFIVLIALMLQPTIFIEDSIEVLGEMYFRIVGASAIISGTLSILTIIFHKIYMHNHPEFSKPDQPKKGLSIWVWIVIIYFLIQFLSLLVTFAGASFSKAFH